jgi:hypothetical protein
VVIACFITISNGLEVVNVFRLVPNGGNSIMASRGRSVIKVSLIYDFLTRFCISYLLNVSCYVLPAKSYAALTMLQLSLAGLCSLGSFMCFMEHICSNL